MFPSLSSSETNIKLPFSFIIYSLLAFISSQILLLLSGNNIIEGIFRVPTIWSGVHLLVLGWALMVAMGAMYQLVPVAFLTPIWSEKFGFFQFIVTAVGITGFAISLFNAAAIYMVYTGSLAILGIILFLVQMFMTLRTQKKKNILTLFVGTALTCLLITITLGLLLVSNMAFGIGIDHLKILKTHILLGISGWFTLLIFGFSYKMAPMFALSHGYSMKLSKHIYITYVSGLIFIILSIIYDQRYLFQLGLIILFIAFSIFLYHIRTIYLKRMKKKLDNPFAFSLISIIFGASIHFFAVILSFFPSYYEYYGILIYLHIFIWIVCSITGYLLKIVPFLWWTHKYSEHIGKANVPTLKSMTNDKFSDPIYITFVISALGVSLSIILKSLIIFYIFQSLLVVAVTFYSYAVINVLRK